MKDNFSTNSDHYRDFRPGYPLGLFEFVYGKLGAFENAWDCGCGNGQLTEILRKRFGQVFATDISASQLDHAPRFINVQYSLQPAENTNFPNNHFDLITVGQAIHWFQFGEFYKEVRRTAKKGALLVIVGYGKLSINAQVDETINKLYSEILDGYWDPERRYIDEMYTTIPFPFDEISCPSFENSYMWTLEHLLGYLRTWSAVKHYRNRQGVDPVTLISESLALQWEDKEIKKVEFPLLLRIGKV
ncbi:MAG: class I SAM-dependent methyltransferase [Sediminicola sp.]